MKSILIVDTDVKKEEGLVNFCTSKGLKDVFSFETTASFGQPESWWLSDGPDVVVISMPDDEVLQGFFIRKIIKDLPKLMPIIFIASTITPAFMQLSTGFTKLRTLKAPTYPDEVILNIQDLLTARPSNQQQRHQRYDVDQQAQVIIDGQSYNLPMRVKNLSLGGAYLEFTGVEKLPKVGDQVLVEIGQAEGGKPFSFSAVVVWATALETGQGIGVKFIHNAKLFAEYMSKDEE